MPLQPAWLDADHSLVPTSRLCRRRWLFAAAVGPWVLSAWPREAVARQEKQEPTEAEEIAQVEALAREKGLGPFIHVRSRKGHFLGMGDAPKEFCEAALGICESLEAAFLPYFQAQGFKIASPKRALTVITLKDDASYRAWSGDDPGANVGGHYDLISNRLVMFDFRPRRDGAGGPADLVDAGSQGPDRRPNPGANAELINRISLVHETAHLLSFNTGLLSRDADVPDWVSEGLAIYVELWRRSKPQRKIGTLHGPWLQELRKDKPPSASWIPIRNLVAGDEAIWAPETQEQAYAESWLLVYYLMKKEPKKFQAYLAALKGAKDDSKRIELFEKELGPTKTVGGTGRSLSQTALAVAFDGFQVRGTCHAGEPVKSRCPLTGLASWSGAVLVLPLARITLRCSRS